MRFLLWLESPGRGAVTGPGVDVLRRRGEVGAVSSRDAFLRELPKADAVVVSPWLHPRTEPDDWLRGERLKVVSGTFDFRFNGWINFRRTLERGVQIVDTSRSMTPTVAEFAVAMMLNLLRDIPVNVQLVRSGGWLQSAWDNEGFISGDLTGRAVGLAGFGSINRRLAELLVPFRCSIQAFDPHVDEAVMAGYRVGKAASLVETAAGCELFVVGIPPTPSTLRIVGADVIRALPKGALFVLVTRMAVVDQQALWERLKKGEIRAAVDVFDPEPPPPDAPFLLNPNVLPTPHLAGNTRACHRRCFENACADAVAVMDGKEPRYAAGLRDYRIYQREEEG